MSTIGAVPRQHALGQLLLSPNPAARTLRRVLLLLIFALGMISFTTPLWSLEEPYVYRKDLIQEYSLAKAIQDGSNPYLPSATTLDMAAHYIPGFPDRRNPSISAYHPTPHPPTAGLLFLPFSLIGYRAAAVCWLAFQLMALALSIWYLARGSMTRFPVWAAMAATGALLAWYPLTFELSLGQLTLVQLAFLSSTWLGLRSGKPRLSGIMLGFALLVKPFLWPLLLPFLAKRNWKLLAASAVTFAIGWGAATSQVGITAIATYFTQALPIVNEGYKAQSSNISLASIGWKLFDGTGSAMALGATAPPLIKSLLVARVVSLVLPIGALVAGALVAIRMGSTLWAFALMICISILVSPISWSFYLILTLIPCALIAEWLVSHKLPPGETSAALLVAILLLLPPDAWAILVNAALRWFLPGSASTAGSISGAIADMSPAVALIALTGLITMLGGKDRAA